MSISAPGLRSAARLAHRTYKLVVPYRLRIAVWSWRRRTRGAGNAASVEDLVARLTAPNASPFEAAVYRHFDVGNMHDPMWTTWVSYALGTNDRGRDAVETIRRYTSVRGKRHLDIGCAYGGTPIAFAQAGARATGIEIDPALLELAHANLADHPSLDCTVMVGDILQPEIAGSLSAFDIITCENVIEHVDVARELVATIRSLLTDEGVAHLAIPNAFAFSEVARDGHYGLFALTLLPRDRSIVYFEASDHTEPYTVGEYYFTFEHYVEMFQEEGLSIELLNPLEPSRADLDALRRDMDSLPGKYEDAVRQDKIPSLVRDEVKARLLDYLSGYEAMRAEYENASGDKRNALARQLLRHYRQDLWYVLARPLPASVPAGGR